MSVAADESPLGRFNSATDGHSRLSDFHAHRPGFCYWAGAMAKRLVNVDRDTPLLLPPSIQEWVPQDDMSRFIVDAVGLLEERHFGYNWRGSGSEQYPPRMMLALLIHCYANRLFSSRRIERATWRDIAVRYITAHPSGSRHHREIPPGERRAHQVVLH
jgi:hypothetical protein